MHMTAEWRNKMLNKLLKSVLDQDLAPVVVCDIDDMHRTLSIKKNLLNQKGDTKQMKVMLTGVGSAGDYKSIIKRNCINVFQPFGKNAEKIDFYEAVKYAIALGKRAFVLDVLPNAVLDLAIDRRSTTGNPKKKRWLKR